MSTAASSGPPGGLPEIAAAAVTGLLDRSPAHATYLGDHTRDALLDDPSAAAADARAAQVRVHLAALDALVAQTPDEQVDADVLRTVLAAELLELDDLREAEWNPMLHNPGGGLHALLSRDFAPLPQRLRSLEGRVEAVPAYLAAARTRLGVMSAIHVETALNQLRGTIALLDTGIPAALERAQPSRDTLVAAVEPARTALLEHCAWLRDQAPRATRDPRIGADRFRAKLALTLDTEFAPAALLASAELDVDRLQGEITDLAGRIARVARPDAETVRTVLDGLAADAPSDATILTRCRAAVVEATRFVRAHDLVTVHDDPVAVVLMPEIDRGVAVAYCRPNGPLETADLPTEFAVSPTPADWTAGQVSSFYREYNSHMVHDLTVHEAMPGHALQLMHANRHRGVTPIRSVWWSGSFVEGWAVYAEELMADYGYRSEVSVRDGDALRMQQLKMQLRSTINAVLDIRYHCDDLDETAAMRLMLERGFQERGEAAGKWRRVQLSSTQLCTYYVGYTEVRAVAAQLRAAHPGWSERAVHDAMLSHGSPPARHLRTLLGLPSGDR